MCGWKSKKSNRDPPQLHWTVRYLNLATSSNIWLWLSLEICVGLLTFSTSAEKPEVLGMIYRMVSTNTSNSSTISKLYVALVRPHLEYATQVWNPHLTKDINCLEKDQKFALRICSKNYHEPCQNLLEHTNYHHFKTGGCFCVYVLRTTALGPPMTGPCLVGAGPSPVLTGLSPPMIGPGPVGTGPSPVLTEQRLNLV